MVGCYIVFPRYNRKFASRAQIRHDEAKELPSLVDLMNDMGRVRLLVISLTAAPWLDRE